MKKMGFSVLGLALVSSLVACPTPPVTPPAQVADGSPISGTISNWQAGKTANLVAQVLFGNTVSSSVTVASDGSFSNLVLPTPSAAELLPLSSDAACAGLVTPADAKFAVAVLATNASSQLVGGVGQANAVQASALLTDPGNTQVLRYYANKDVVINGTCTSKGPTTTNNYHNVSFKAGWNILTLKQATHAINSTDPYVNDSNNGPVPSDAKFYFVYPDAQNFAQVRTDFAKKLVVKWDALTNATGYTLEVKASSASQYSAPITVASNQAEIPGLTPNTNYDVRLKTLFGTNSSFGTNSFGFSTATLNTDGLNIQFPTQGVPNPVSIAAGANKSVAL